MAVMVDIQSIAARIARGLNVGADIESLHQRLVDDDGLTEEEFFLAYNFAVLMSPGEDKVQS